MPDYMYMLESRLSTEQRAAVLRLQELSTTLEENLYLVGGAVRDLISGMPIRDLDFVVEGNPTRLAREMEKGGARILLEDEKMRHVELLLAGEVDASLSGARDDVYVRPGTRPELRWSTVMEDLRRRDFSLNAIAISLNAASRGLLLDPTNGLADLERREVRALTIHSFTNQPVRLLRALRYSARMGFKLESRTAEWFALAIERELHHTIDPEDAGQELRDVAREEKPAAILKAWEAHDLVAAIYPQLAKRHPDYDAIARLVKVRDDMASVGLRPRLHVPMTYAILGRLKSRERSSALDRAGFRAAEAAAVGSIEDESLKFVKLLAGRKTAAPGDAYALLEKSPLDLMAFTLAESSNGKALGKIKNYMNKWRPLRQALPGVEIELEQIGLARGPKFDKVMEQFFRAQLEGKGRKLEEHPRLLRQLAGIKEPPKKKIKEEKKPKIAGKPERKADAVEPAASEKPAAAPSAKSSSLAAKLKASAAAKKKAPAPAKVKSKAKPPKKKKK
jgi:tRNA nucleotidyltransferase (CCA-adding enzyme)